MAAELAVSMEPPTACTSRQMMSHIAPLAARNGSKERKIEAMVNTTNPAL